MCFETNSITSCDALCQTPLVLMWDEHRATVAPRNFKYQLGSYAPRFNGYEQHDSMEFIEYLLDGLREDCNKVQGKKPLVELKDANGRPDGVVAAEAWIYIMYYI